MDRRRFLQLGASVGVGAAVAGSPLRTALARPLARSVATRATYVPVPAFPSGVLSGDPAADGVVLWTRIDPVVAGAGADVGWEVADDVAFGPGSVVASGTVATTAATDHTASVAVDGLAAGTTYWYRFVVAATTSPVGRTRTLPDGPVDRLRLAYFSCQRYVHGYYTAHADLAARALDPSTDVDLVVSLGDYVYEAGPADGVTVAGRTDPDAPTETLEDFRRQYHRYRTDPDLQAMHAAFPIVGVFDNHDGMRDGADPTGPGARAAFFEQMPVRRTPGDPDRQHRSFLLGDLCDLYLLDARQHRDPLPASGDNPLGTTTIEQPEMVEPGRTMLGEDQRTWLQDGLASSPAAWKVVGSQLMFAPLRSQRDDEERAAAGDGPHRNAGRYVNLVGWDGYQAERRQLVDHLADEGVADVLVVSGDSHFWTASELPRDHDDPASPLVLAEFGGSSVTSANAGEQTDLPGNDLIRPVVADANRYSLRYIEVTTHGYGLVDLTAAGAEVTFVAPGSTRQPVSASATLARFRVERGSAEVRQVEGSDFLARPASPEPPPAPDGPGPSAPGGDEPVPASAASAVPGAPAYTG